MCVVKPLLLLAASAVLAYAQPAPVRILVAYYSETGNTEKLAQAIGKGAAAVEGVEVSVKKTVDVKDEEFPRYDGMILGTPVHWANLTAEAKRFLDRAGAALWNVKTTGDGRTAGAFATGGGPSMGKEMARLSILTAFLTMRFTVVGGVDDNGFGTLGPEATTGPADPGISDKELADARRFGERFARATKKLH